MSKKLRGWFERERKWWRSHWPMVTIILGSLAIAYLLTGCALMGQSAGLPPMDANGDGILDQEFRAAISNLKTTVDVVTGGAAAPATGLLELLITGGSAVAVALGARKVDHVIKAKKQAVK